MIVSKITISHTANILERARFRIQYNNTVTNVAGSINAENMESTKTPTGWHSFFVTNSVFSNSLFSFAIAADGLSFSFQARTADIVFTDYTGLNRLLGIFGDQPITTGFTFEITTVDVSDAPSVPQDLPIADRTNIDNASKIKFCNSPIFIRHSIIGLETSIKVSLFIWDGAQNKPMSIANLTLNKEKVSISDNYISLEISDLIRPYIKPKFAYNRAAPAAITNQGVFVQAVIETNLGAKTFTPTYFVTLGYRWNYEQNLIADNGVQNYGASGFIEVVEKWYNPKIHNYFEQTFNFTRTVANGTTANVINYVAITPTKLRCTLDPTLIVFINKLGLWETFTPHGKKTVTAKSDRQISNVSHRDPSRVDNTYTHSKQVTSITSLQSYLINTGALDENMTSIIEQLIYSPLVYLINFKGDLELVTTVGITIDNTFVSIDSEVITIDSQSITDEAIGFFKTHQQIPVVITDEDFTRKTRLNDKIAIDYNLKFDETTSKILNIR